jgi:hypothetical protein
MLFLSTNIVLFADADDATFNACAILFLLVSFRRFLGDARREFMPRIYVVRHVMRGSYLRDALQEGGATDVARLPIPRP